MSIIDETLAAFGPTPRRYPIIKGEHGYTHYGPWTIHYEPPPIPPNRFGQRLHDWHYVHENYDASYEGEEDGWVDNGLSGTCASFADALNEIDEFEDDQTQGIAA
jgi:hypothetical protein